MFLQLVAWEKKEHIMNQYLEIGKITNTHALKGELKMLYWCDDPSFLKEVEYFFLDNKGKSFLNIKNSRLHKNFLILKIDGIDSIDEAQKMINKVLYINRDSINLDDGEYFQQDLLGMNVIDIDSNQDYGSIINISRAGFKDVYYIKDSNGRERLIPAIGDVIKEVDLKNNKMLIRPLEGLFD